MAFWQSCVTLPRVSCPSSVVRSIMLSASLSASTFDSFLILRLKKRARRSSTPTSSTAGTRSSAGSDGGREVAATLMGGCRATRSRLDERRIESELDHFIEGRLPLREREGGAALDVVAHGADRQRFGAEFRGEGIDASRFHLDADDIVFRHDVEHLGLG